MIVGYPRSESDHVFAPLAVFFGLLVCLGLYPGDLRFLAPFTDASKGTLMQVAVR
jgi:hypothetical protein